LTTGRIHGHLSGFAERRSEVRKQVGAAQQQLDTVREAIKLVAGMNGGVNLKSKPVITQVAGKRKKGVLSAAARAKISKATKARWAKFRAEKKGKA
jgi:hypothetical protein